MEQRFAVYAVSEKVYKAAAAAQQANQGADATPNNDSNVYETDYKDVDDTQK